MIHACTDRIVLPHDRGKRMAMQRDSLWSDATIRIKFLDGKREVWQRVAGVAKEWMQYMGLSLEFNFDRPEADADVRISFRQRGSWSLVGTMCGDADFAGKATMNLGWLTENTDTAELRRVVLHEFGHALGCIHEHQHPAAKIEWDKRAVYDFYAEPPNCWSRAEVDKNVFALYDENDLVNSKKYDPQSIMVYPIPPEFVKSGATVDWNSELSDGDKKFIRERYPK